ncbi:hypothetical protein CAPTEDRAFT_141416 [Capitella teleta]|uniref:Carnosine N-methyltransferase n=1 Tax=Capitella teleta TaxID=283909 RepID=R7UIP4_CAPTE|nr:hypothetical protein CAPTEDRAFT_141416 [Capitella teleta]|eukprot:ELU06434.1 hypothetical protein CAPTEDRAFT_141416 [Capitella teleta]
MSKCSDISDTELSDDRIEGQVDDKEVAHFRRVLNAFLYYRSHTTKRLLIAMQHFNNLPPAHKELLPDFKEHLSQIRICMEHNYEILKLISSSTENMFENREHNPNAVRFYSLTPASEFDMDKVKTTLKQFVRDWSAEGAEERKGAYDPVIEEISRLFPGDIKNLANVKILVPGAGLGRLAFEIARRGYSCQGNEFSLFMLFASHFVLNKCTEVNSLTLYPWIHQFSNNLSSNDQIRAVTFPDINPSHLPVYGHFSMAAGDFLDVYTEPDSWDCVSTVFFIDTAHNIIEYIETIEKILKPGGYWINLGPLLYHFADMINESSIELPYDKLKEIIQKKNFEIIVKNLHQPAAYTQNPKSMLKYRYDCVFFVARKKLQNKGSSTR